MLHEVLQSIDQRRDFVLTSHARPDGDAIGSVLAAGQMLRELGKRVDIVMSDGVPSIYHGLPTWETVQHKSRVQGGYEAAVILECDSVQRTGVAGLDEGGRFLINIDHHSSAKPFGHVNW
ncbi:MAG: DHH family phosphoesterase, partial [Terriglobales bacterium]